MSCCGQGSQRMMNQQIVTNGRIAPEQVELVYKGRRNVVYFKPVATGNRYIANKGQPLFAWPDDVQFLLNQHAPEGALFEVAPQLRTDGSSDTPAVVAPQIVPATDNRGNRGPRTARRTVEDVLKEHTEESGDVLPAGE